MACRASRGSADGSASWQGTSCLCEPHAQRLSTRPDREMCEPHTQILSTRQDGGRGENDLDKLKAWPGE